MREHDPLGHPRGSTGVHDDGRVRGGGGLGLHLGVPQQLLAQGHRVPEGDQGNALGVTADIGRLNLKKVSSYRFASIPRPFSLIPREPEIKRFQDSN